MVFAQVKAVWSGMGNIYKYVLQRTKKNVRPVPCDLSHGTRVGILPSGAFGLRGGIVTVSHLSHFDFTQFEPVES